MTNDHSHIKIFSKSHIRGATLIIGFVLSTGIGIAIGLILAATNWFQLRKKVKAFWSFGIGIFSALLVSITYHIWNVQNPLPPAWQFVLSFVLQGTLILLTIAIFEKLLKNDLEQVSSTEVKIENYSIGATLGITIASFLILWGVVWVSLFGVEVLMAPKVKPTSSLIASGAQSVIGTISAWSHEPIANRQLALCQLEKKPLAPYDCLVTHLTATTNNNGEFQIRDVPAGKYLIIYDTGLTDFQKGLEIWQDRELRPGNLSWQIENDKQLYEECGSDFYLIMPGNQVTDFYFSKVEYVFTQCGSYFFLAHDISAALTYEEEDHLKRLPNDVFKPVVVEVVPNNDSIVTFDVLYAPR